MKYFVVVSSISLIFLFLLGCSDRSINQASFQANERVQTAQTNSGTIVHDSEGATFSALLYPIQPKLKREKKGEVTFKFDDKLTNFEFTLTVYDVSDIVSAYIFIGNDYLSDKTPLVELFPSKRVSSANNDPQSRIVAQGNVTVEDLLFQLKGNNLEALHQLMSESKAYVTVSTDKYPADEIFGTIRSNVID